VEYGKKWHDAGTKMQNKMYLMISSLLPNTLSLKNIRRPTPCHSWWIKWWFISRATMTQRPELMKVALPAVGVMDMLRYHTFTQEQVGLTITELHRTAKR
jgi:prolyl oligopeptidase